MGYKVNLYIGFSLGILLVSCLTVVICFGSYAAHYPEEEKMYDKLYFRSSSAMYDCSVAIAVLGSFAIVFIVTEFILSIKNIYPLIFLGLGIITFLFTTGCAIAEGIYTLKAVKANSETSYYIDNSHKSAQKYIKKAIEELYKQGKSNLESEYGFEDLPNWNYAENQLGKVDEYGYVYTYNNIWSSPRYQNITLRVSDGFIEACYSSPSYCSIVASLQFYHRGTIQLKQKICWFNKDKTNIKCKYYKSDKIPDCDYTFYVEPYHLTENIVVGKYYSQKDVYESDDITDVDYTVYQFPHAYKKLTYNEVQEIYEKIQEDEENEDYDDYCKHSHFAFKDSSKSCRVSGKKYAKVNFNLMKFKEDYFDNFYMAPSKPKNMDDYYNKCEAYNENQDEDNYDEFICKGSFDFDELADYFQFNYKDNNKGKTAPAIKKFYDKESRAGYNTAYRYSYSMYFVAFSNFIIQSICLVIWLFVRITHLCSYDD